MFIWTQVQPPSICIVLGILLLSTLAFQEADSFSIQTTTDTLSTSSPSSPSDFIRQFAEGQSAIASKQKALTNTVLCVPPECVAEDVVFYQKATGFRIKGKQDLCDACSLWDQTFQTDQGDVQGNVSRVSTITNNTVLTQWNVSWVPPTAAWLEFLAESWPGVRPIYRDYSHLAGEISVFSWKAVGKLFADASRTGELRIPLATICGTSTYQFRSNPNIKDASVAPWQVTSITEELNYAMDLKSGRLKNRKCANDLRLFLESGRATNTLDDDDWYDIIETALPWSSVPGSNVMDLEPQEDGPLAAVIFLSIAAAALVLFAALLAPELIGQSLFGPPSYIVRPSELDSIF